MEINPIASAIPRCTVSGSLSKTNAIWPLNDSNKITESPCSGFGPSFLETGWLALREGSVRPSEAQFYSFLVDAGRGRSSVTFLIVILSECYCIRNEFLQVSN